MIQEMNGVLRNSKSKQLQTKQYQKTNNGQQNTTRTTTKHHTYNYKTPHVQLQKRKERLVHI